MWRLSFRYGIRWRDITWNRRILRKGKERRARLARDVLKKSTNGPGTAEDEIATFVNSLNRRVRPSVRRGRDGRYAEEEDSGSQKNGTGISHKEALSRRKDTRKCDRIPQTESQSSRRSSFASEASSYSMNVLPSAARHDTTRSTYFKMKALGLEPSAGQPTKPHPRSAKRIRSNDDFHDVVDKRRFSTSPSSPSSLQPSTTPSGPSLHRTINDEDVEIFAAVRAARDAMSESISFFKEEMAKDELSRSRSSEGLNNSTRTANPPPPPPPRFDQSTPSTTTLSPGSATFSKEPPPKYRNRVSKFLPREMYADVLRERQRRANVNGMPVPTTAATRTKIRGRMGISTARTPLRPQASPAQKLTAPSAAPHRIHPPVAIERHANPFAALSEEGIAEDDEDGEDVDVHGHAEQGEQDRVDRLNLKGQSDAGGDIADDEHLNEAEGPGDEEEWDEDEEDEHEEEAGGPFEDEYDDEEEVEEEEDEEEEREYDDDSQPDYTDGEYPAAAATPPRLLDGKSGASADDAIEL